MRRISSLPTSEFCSMPDKIGQDVASTQSERSTVFHAYCDTGKWPESLRNLPEADIEEIGKWLIPMPFVYKTGTVTHALPYQQAYRETRVALDKDFMPVIVDKDVAQADIATQHPEVMIVGHLDMAWVVDDLVIICDIKSSIYAVADRCDSLQLHGYGLALAILLGKPRYLTSIWDASEGRYYVRPGGAVELDSFEAEELKDRIRRASEDRDGGYVTGTHCSGCWKRSHCQAHLVDVPEGEFRALLSGKAMEADLRNAIVKHGQLRDLEKSVGESIRAWVKQHGPVRSEDGKKHYRCHMVDGRGGYDYDAIQHALGVENLDGFKKKGNPYEKFDWRKRD